MIQIKFYNNRSEFDSGFIGRKLREVSEIGEKPTVYTERRISRNEIIISLLNDNRENLSKSETPETVINSIISKLETLGFTHKETIEEEQQ